MHAAGPPFSIVSEGERLPSGRHDVVGRGRRAGQTLKLPNEPNFFSDFKGPIFAKANFPGSDEAAAA
jgi:hypothetical protein